MEAFYNLYPLAVFRAVARLASVTRAAQELGMSQPAASAHLKALEERFGGKLLERTPQGMILTDRGREVARHAAQVFAHLEELDCAGRGQGAPWGEVRLAASHTPGAYLLPFRLRAFRERHPQVHPVPSIAASAEVLRRVKALESPLGILGELSTARWSQGLERRLLGTDRLQLMGSAENPLARRESIAPRELKSQTLLLREPGSSTRSYAEAMLGELIPCFGRVLELASGEALKESVIAGLGVAVLSCRATTREERAGLLCPLGNLAQERPFFMVRREGRSLSRATEALWDYLAEPEEPRSGISDGPT